MATEPNKSGEGTPDGGEKITFTDEQQKYINETLIKEAMGRAGREARQKAEQLENDLKSIKDELAAAKEALAKAATPAAKKEAKEDIEALRAEFENITKGIKDEAAKWQREAQAKAKEADDARKDMLGLKKRHAITSAASKNPFHNLDAVLKLTEDSVEWDEDLKRYIVRDEQGGIRHNSSMQYMTLDEYYIDYLAKNPWMASGQMKGGSGGSENGSNMKNTKYSVEEVFGPKADAAKAMKLKRENPDEYNRLKKVAKDARIIA